MLNENGIEFTYREYTQEPLSIDELRDVMAKLACSPRDVLRARDAKKAGLTGDETDEQLLELMANNPRLLQRPIGVMGLRAVVGRPADRLLSVVQ